MFAQSEIDQFRNEGWVAKDEFWSAREVEAMRVELPADGVAFFAYGVAHCTLGNTTDKERAGVALHFINGAMDATAKSGFKLGKRPYLTGDESSGGLKEHGAVIAGTWEQEVASVLNR